MAHTLLVIVAMFIPLLLSLIVLVPMHLHDLMREDDGKSKDMDAKSQHL